VTPVTSTFLFADLVGWTALVLERGDDHGAEVAVGFQRRAKALLGSGGEEVKSLGDGVMLRLENPVCALHLALQLVDEAPVPARVGIHTGPAVEREGDWYGTTVNVAARLCSAAGGGQVLVSEATLQACGDPLPLALSERRLHWLRNLREPVAAHVVERAPVPRFARAKARVVRAKTRWGCPHARDKQREAFA
jgi:class 3 adenylate cyclase